MLQQLLSYHKANSKIPIHQLSIPNPGVFSTKISHFKCPGAMSRTGEASLSDSSKFSEFSEFSDNGALAYIPSARHRLYEAQGEGRLPAPTCANAWLGKSRTRARVEVLKFAFITIFIFNS